MRTVSIISIILVLLMISSLSAAEVNSIAAPKCAVNVDKVIVPIELNNVQPMAALDLPLEFSEGVTLEERRNSILPSPRLTTKIISLFLA